MKPIKRYLPKDMESVKIEIFSDLHLGSPRCKYNDIKEKISRIAAEPNTYCVILGDLINNSTKTSVGDVYSEELTPMQQIQLAVETFRPIKDKILAVTSGNHERRSYKTDGIDLLYFFCSELGIPDLYDYTSVLLFLRVGKSEKIKTDPNRQQTYSIYLTHGDGNGGRTVGGKANGLERRGAIVNSDIVIAGHTHAPMTFRNAFYEIDYRNSCVKQKEQVFVNAGATLDYESYAELYGLRPSSLASPFITLSGKHKNIKVHL